MSKINHEKIGYGILFDYDLDEYHYELDRFSGQFYENIELREVNYSCTFDLDFAFIVVPRELLL